MKSSSINRLFVITITTSIIVIAIQQKIIAVKTEMIGEYETMNASQTMVVRVHGHEVAKNVTMTTAFNSVPGPDLSTTPIVAFTHSP